MEIKGNENLSVLKKYCCSVLGDDSQDYLVIDDKCIRSLLEECKRICLFDFAVPVDEITEMTKIMNPQSSSSLEDFKVMIVFIEENKSLLYRHIDGYTIDKEILRYKYSSTLTIDDIDFGETIPAIMNFTMIPSDTSILANWTNINSLIVGNEPFDVWVKAQDYWKNMSPERINNTIILPEFVYAGSVNLFLNEIDNILSNTVEFCVGNDDINFKITASVSYDIDNDLSTFTIDKIKLSGKFIDDDVVHIQNTLTHIFTSPQVTIESTGDMASLNAKNFMNLNSLLVLSSESLMKKLELFNNSIETRKLRILMAK